MTNIQIDFSNLKDEKIVASKLGWDIVILPNFI